MLVGGKVLRGKRLGFLWVGGGRGLGWGGRGGFDCELTAMVSAAVQIPVIASGGAGSAGHFVEVFGRGRADAALAASIFPFGVTDSRELKAELQRAGVSVRLPC